MLAVSDTTPNPTQYTLSSRLHDRRLHLGLLLACILVGFMLRIEVVRNWNVIQPDSPERLVGDEPGYDNIARELLLGYGFTWPGRVPLYSVWLALVYYMGGGSYNFAAYAQAIVSVLAIPLVYVLGSRLFNSLAGIAAALLATISYVLIFLTFRILSENLYIPALLLVMITLWDAMQKPTLRRFLIAGVLLGVSNLIRPTLLLFPVVIILLLWFRLNKRQAIRYGIVYLAASVLVVTPWVIHNYLRYQAFFPLQTSNAILWQGSPEYYYLVKHQGYTYMQVWSEILYGPGWEERDPTSIEGDRYWTTRALDSISSDPLTYLRYAAEKVVTFWVGDPNADWDNTYIFNYRALRSAGFPREEAIQYMIALFLPVVALGAGIMLYDRFKHLLPLYALLGYFTLLHAATHAEARLSAPLQTFLFILIAGAMVKVFDRRSSKRQETAA